MKDCPQHRLYVEAGERRQDKLADKRHPVQRCQQLVQTQVNLIMTISQHDEGGLCPQLACQIEEPFKTGVVGPMQILEDHQQGLL